MLGRSAVSRLLVAVVACLVGMTLIPSAQVNAAYRRPGTTRQVDLTSDGRPAPRDSVTSAGGRHNGWGSSISADGRFVAFTSPSALVPEDTNNLGVPGLGFTDIYLRDLRSNSLSMLTRSPEGTPAVGLPLGTVGSLGVDGEGREALSWDVAISANGRYVTFVSNAINLVPGDTNLAQDVFGFDRKTKTIERLSVDSSGNEAELSGQSYGPSIDGSGNLVSFTSLATNLVDGDTNGAVDIFVRDRRAGRTERISVSSEGEQAEYPACAAPAPLPVVPGCVAHTLIFSSINLTGRHVAFDSYADNLVEDDTNQIEDVFVRDRETNRTERVSVGSGRVQAEPWLPSESAGASRVGGMWGPTIAYPTANMISSDGRYVLFYSSAANLVPQRAPNGETDMYVHDRKEGRTERVSVDSHGGMKSTSSVWYSALSANGRYAIWSADANGIKNPEPTAEEDPTGGGNYVYIHDRRTGSLQFITLDSQGNLGRGCGGVVGDKSAGVSYDDISPSGRYVLFASCDGNLSEPARIQGDQRNHIFLRDRGLDVGAAGGLIDSGRLSMSNSRSFSSSGVASAADMTQEEAAAYVGADLIGASVAYRADSEELFLRSELKEMPAVRGRPARTDAALLYSFGFAANGTRYEVRVQEVGGTDYDSPGKASFGLWRCHMMTLGGCTKIEALHGGFGTTGDRVVVTLPLEAIGLHEGGTIEGLEAATGIGSYHTGMAEALDVVRVN